MRRNNWLISAPVQSPVGKADTPLHPFLIRLMRGEDLSFEDAEKFFLALTDENANQAQIAGALVALAIKGETPEELAGMAKAMRQKAIRIRTTHRNFIDTAGTGSGKQKTFNVSTAAAFVIAGAGLPVAKHGNRAVTSKTGSADVLEALGVNIMVDPSKEEACLEGIGICFMFAPKFHPSLLRVGDIRRNLGVRTSLNLLGPLSNPANAPKQLIGVWHESLVKPMAKALAILGIEKAWVVHGSDGLDEITLSGETLVAEVEKGKVKIFKVLPEDFGLSRCNLDSLRVNSPEESAQIILDVLKGNRRDSARDLIVINAAAAVFLGGLAKDLSHAARLCEQSIDSGKAQNKLERLIQITS
ncbi:MAG: anthranilate phosphoribosyltransferase [Pyrinomonadaceae bacterium]|nr:anthranilate phosphoribosyltransferase [Pyrinomonadaceae bacterium]MCX7639643.1 anthranilate phosphoribosyltransferase [Pyrinomonadaceae bacterium]MDW8303339.1 anthranilate phosphoribosyltransferase [Acidobacteriota bacterium]